MNTETEIGFSYTREADGRVAIKALLGDGTIFLRSIWSQDPQERTRYLNELTADKPGLASEREPIRKYLIKIARASAIDLRFNTCIPRGGINGKASCSARLWNASKVIETVSLNLMSPSERRKAIAIIAPLIARKPHTQRKLDAAKRTLNKLFMDELQRVLTAPPPSSADTSPTAMRDNIPYEATDDGLNSFSRTHDGQDVILPLTNFAARVVTEISRDDGSNEPELEFEMEVKVRGEKAFRRINVKAKEFNEMNWATTKIGLAGHIFKGRDTKESARDAIVRLSASIGYQSKRVQTHTGFVKDLDGNWCYTHGAGVLCATGKEPKGIGAELDAGITNFQLATDQADDVTLRRAIRASLKMVDERFGPRDATYPVYCLIWRSVIERSRFTVHIAGETGAFKSELATLGQRHFGVEMTADNLPMYWNNATAIGVGEIQFLIKDAMAVVDEFKLIGGEIERQKHHAFADKVIRNQANGSGRLKGRDVGGICKIKPPRGTLLSTGEHIPIGTSCRGRMLIIQIAKGEIDKYKLGECQEDADAGLYVIAMTEFLRWLCTDNRIERCREDLHEVIRATRQRRPAPPKPSAPTQAGDEDEDDDDRPVSVHQRTPEILANLHYGMTLWLEFCQAKGAISTAEALAHETESWAALQRVALLQIPLQGSDEPASRYLDLLMAALGGGKGYLAAADGKMPAPENAMACGWWQKFGTGNWETKSTNRLGFIDADGYYFDPDLAYAAAQDIASRGGRPLVEPEEDLRKRLEEKGFLLKDPDPRNRRTVRRTFAGMLHPKLLWLRPGALPIDFVRNVRIESEEGTGQ